MNAAGRCRVFVVDVRWSNGDLFVVLFRYCCRGAIIKDLLLSVQRDVMMGILLSKMGVRELFKVGSDLGGGWYE